MSARITVVGSLNMDLVIHTPRIPQPGETVLGGAFHTFPGGKGANQAVAAARLGAQVTMVGRVGQDEFGASLRQNLGENGVDHTYVLADPQAATGMALIEVDADGQNSIVVASGANMQLSPADVEAAQDAIASADVLLLQLECPLETVIRAAELGQEAGVTVILNPAPAPQHPLPVSLFPLIDILTPNEHETALLTGSPYLESENFEGAAKALQRLGISVVLLTLGEQGALLAEAETLTRFPAFKIKPVDTTAAGDAFMGGLALALAEDLSLHEAVRWGNAAGALAATQLGAQPSLPTRAALEKLLKA